MTARGLRRSYRLLRAFRREQTDPAASYLTLARDAVVQLGSYTTLRNSVVLDVGGGPGYFADALESAGAHAYTVDSVSSELGLHDRLPHDAVVADGTALPISESAVDVCCALNMLEHVPEPWKLLDELVRVTAIGGIVFISVTNWWSPWGGHETSPWHYVGGEWAAVRYENHRGAPPKNRFGKTLFKVHVSELLKWAHSTENVELVDALPRYYPSWCRPLVHVPGLREVATWNLTLVLRRT